MLTNGCKDEVTNVNLDDYTAKLDKLNWSEKNYQVINQFIKDYGKDGKFYNSQKPPYIVLDWDQTCAHFDVGEAVMRYQLTHLRFKMTKEQFKILLKDEINGINKLSSDFKNLLLSYINEDIIKDYNFLYDNFIANDGKTLLSEIQKTSEYKDFLAKLPYLYSGYCGTTGIEADYGYP
jgi:hypothetical protein